MPPDQQNNQQYSQYGVFWLYNWFQAGNGNMYIYFLMNGNIYGSSLSSASSEPYEWCDSLRCYSAYPIPPAPPANVSTITGEPIFVQSYINAYNTAFNQPVNSQRALNKYKQFTNVNNNFVPGTFGYEETYNSYNGPFHIGELIDNSNNYIGTPYLFVSVGSGGGSGFMYLDWVIVTYGVPYVISVS